MKWLRWSSLILIVIVLSNTVSVTQGQSGIPTWTQPVSLGLGWWESITVDQQGTAYVGWFQERTKPQNGPIGSDLLMYAQKPLNGDWSVMDIIATNTQGYTIRNGFAVASDGEIYAAFRSENGHVLSHANIETALSPQAWADPTSLTFQGYYMDFIADDQDNLHFVFSGRISGGARAVGATTEGAESNPCANCGDLYYMRSEDRGKTWSRLYPVSIETTTGSDRVELYQGKSGRIYIDWDEGIDWYSGRGSAKDVRIIYSDDHGLTWSDPIILDGGNFPDRRPIQIATTEMQNGDIMTVWRYHTMVGENRIYYQISSDSGLTWTEPEVIEGIYARNINETPLDDYQLVTDLLGTVHLFAVGRTSPDVMSMSSESEPTSIFHIEYRQGSWRTPQIIASGRNPGDNLNAPPGIFPEWPKAVVGPLNDIHLSYFVRYMSPRTNGTGIEETGLEVFYAYRTGNTLQQPLPTFVPTLEPTATQLAVFAATTTPYPTTEPVNNTNVRVTSDEYAIQTVLSGLAASLFLCAGVIVFSKIRPRG